MKDPMGEKVLWDLIAENEKLSKALNVLRAENRQLKEENQSLKKIISAHRLKDQTIKETGK